MAVLADWGVSGQNPVTAKTSLTTAVYFPRLIGSQGSFGPPFQPTASNATGQLLMPSNQYAGTTNGIRLRVVAAGTIFTAASQTVNITVQINTGTAASPAYTTLMSTGVLPAFAGRASWMLEGHVTIVGATQQTSGYSVGQITQGKLSGVYFGAANSSNLIDFTAIPATTNPVTLYGANNTGLVANVAFGTGTAGNNATLQQLQVLGD